MPELKSAVAPCFEAATSFTLAAVDGRHWKRLASVSCRETGGYRRVRLLLFHNVELLICNGINASHRDTLAAAGVAVISNVNTLTNEALADLAEGRLKVTQPPEPGAGPACRYTHEQLVAWAHELFSAGGYQVLPGPGEDSFLVDLIAEVDCPVCSRRVRIAICCGAHTYKSQQEIKAFHHATPSGYDARVYVCPAEEQIVESCREYGIEVIDPGNAPAIQNAQREGKLPILKSTVAGHERASATAAQNPN
ncbi:MAG: NifB/NifX family molybdenum-iron cluster-binding protein [bacterium]